MYTKKITYTDYNGIEKTEDICFNLSKRDVMLLQNSVEGGFDVAIEKIKASGDQYKMLALFDRLIQAAYGQKSEDGSRFIKNPALTNEFIQTAAYEALFDEFVTNPEFVKEFFLECSPKEAKASMLEEFNKIGAAE